MRYVLRRLGFFVLTLWVALTLNFLLPRMMPGNPALAVIGTYKGGVSPQALKALEAQFGFTTHQGLISQYVSYLGNVARLNFGISLTTQPGTSVAHIVLDAIPWTLGLVGITTILAFILGTLIGIIGAWRRGGLFDSIMPPILVIMTVIPFFWLGLILILVFGVKLKLLPYFFTYTYTLTPGFTPAFIGNVLEHAILPAFTLLITTIGTWILTMRNTMITTLAEDYVRMARAKGLADHARLRGAERDPAEPDRLRHVAGVHRRRRGADRGGLQLPGRRLAAAAGGLQRRLPPGAGTVPADHCRRAGGDPDLGPAHRDPRPAHEGS